MHDNYAIKSMPPKANMEMFNLRHSTLSVLVLSMYMCMHVRNMYKIDTLAPTDFINIPYVNIYVMHFTWLIAINT